MCGCGYDDLKQRHRESRLKKILTASLAAAVCLTFGAFSTAMALRIQGQKVQILEQKDRIEEQSQEIKNQYQEVLKNQAVLTARESERLLEEGDRVGAVRLVRDILPDQKTQTEDADRAYMPQAQYALTESLYLYENDTSIRPVRQLTHDAAVDYVKVSPEGGYAVVKDAADHLTLWKLSDGSRITEFAPETFASEDQIAFLPETLLAWPSGEGLAVLDVQYPDKRTEYRTGDGNYEGVYADTRNGRFLVAQEDVLSFFTLEGPEPVFSYSCPEELCFAGEAAFDEKGDLAAAALESRESGGHRTRVVIFSYSGKQAVSETGLTEQTGQMVFGTDALYLTANTWLDELQVSGFM